MMHFITDFNIILIYGGILIVKFKIAVLIICHKTLKYSV
jgi:hypothetical protein